MAHLLYMTDVSLGKSIFLYVHHEIVEFFSLSDVTLNNIVAVLTYVARHMQYGNFGTFGKLKQRILFLNCNIEYGGWLLVLFKYIRVCKDKGYFILVIK